MTETDINSTLFEEVSELRDHIAALEARNARLEEQVAGARKALERAEQFIDINKGIGPLIEVRQAIRATEPTNG